MRLTIAGSIYETHSIATSARELALACHAAGIETAIAAPPSAQHVKDHFSSHNPGNYELLEELASHHLDDGYEIRFPTASGVSPSGRQVIRYVLTCHHTRTSAHEFALGNDYYVWANSELSLRSIDCATGFPFSMLGAPRAAVLHHGIDAGVFSPEGRRADLGDAPFKFLFAARACRDKGLPVLLSAFVKEFNGSRDVALIIKAPMLREDAAKWIEEARSTPGAPEIHVHVEEVTTREEMASYYRAADALVHPTRIEGFGLTVLEAAACGLPVIASAWGGYMDLLGRNHPLLVDVTLDPGQLGMIFDPSEESLRKRMRECFERQAAFRKQALMRSNEVRSRWAWPSIIQQLRLYLSETPAS